MLICDGCHAETHCAESHPVTFSIPARCEVCEEDGMCTTCTSPLNQFRHESGSAGSLAEALANAMSESPTQQSADADKLTELFAGKKIRMKKTP